MNRMLLALTVSLSVFALVLAGCGGGAQTQDDPPAEDPNGDATEVPVDDDEDENGDHDHGEEHDHGHDHGHDHANGEEGDDHGHDENGDHGHDENGEEETTTEEAGPTSWPSWAENLRHDHGVWLHAVGHGANADEAEAAARSILEAQLAQIATSYLETIRVEDIDSFDTELVDSYGQSIAEDIVGEAEVEQSEEHDGTTFVELRLDFNRLVDATMSNWDQWFSFMRERPVPEPADVSAGLTTAQEEVTSN